MQHYPQWHGTTQERGYVVNWYRGWTELADLWGEPLNIGRLVPQGTISVVGQIATAASASAGRTGPEPRWESIRANEYGQGPRTKDTQTLWFCDWTALLTNVPVHLLSFDGAAAFAALSALERGGQIDEWQSKKL